MLQLVGWLAGALCAVLIQYLLSVLLTSNGDIKYLLCYWTNAVLSVLFAFPSSAF